MLRLAKIKAALLLASAFAVPGVAPAEIGKFDGYEIRVIRPKFMTKRNRIELATQGSLIMNQSFIYTLMATGLLDYHFSEMLALELGGSYGFTVEKNDKRILNDEYEIKTQILNTSYIMGGGLLWTPLYGKTQLPSGDVVYFDSFLTVQGGLTGVDYDYEQCEVPPGKEDVLPPKPAATSKSYPTLTLGAGQKYFISKDFGLRWDVRDYFIFSYPKADGSCQPEVDQGSGTHHNITLQMGASFFL
jgi:outer membrane beta-barrel protein